MEQILILEDDTALNQGLCKALKTESRKLVSCETVKAARDQFLCGCPSLILLDINLPDGSGLDFLQELKRNYPDIPVILLTANDTDMDIVKGLELGADDYITKPFSTTVLCAKVKACLRRMGLSSRQRESILSLGPFRYVCDEMRLFRDGTEIPLSSKESLLIKYFFNNPNKILSKEQIYRNVWGNDVVDDNTIMVHIRHLRVKIEADATRPNYLRTIRGVGYQFVI